VGFLIAAPEGTGGDLEAGLDILDAGVDGGRSAVSQEAG
jgi:hypothetical protein